MPSKLTKQSAHRRRALDPEIDLVSSSMDMTSFLSFRFVDFLKSDASMNAQELYSFSMEFIYKHEFKNLAMTLLINVKEVFQQISNRHG